MNFLADPEYTPDSSSKNGITRKHRIKYYSHQRSGKASSSDTAVTEKACDLIEACHNKL